MIKTRLNLTVTTILAIVSCFFAPNYVFSLDFNSGNGTVSSPYEIASVDQLVNINNVACSDTGTSSPVYFKLITDIDINTTSYSLNSGWTPICYGKIFYGKFDGNFKTIKNLMMNSVTNNAGLFSENSGTISNLYLNDVNIKAGNHVGAIAGYNSGTIEQVLVSGKIEGKAYVAGLVGSNINGTIKKSVFYGNVLAIDGFGAGITAETNKPIVDSYTHSFIKGSAHIGRLFAINNGSAEINSYHIGSTTDTSVPFEVTFPNASTYYPTFDFVNTWSINDKTNNGYAHLKWQKTFGPWTKDTSELVMTSFTPSNDSVDLPLTFNLNINFNKPVFVNSGKKITLKKLDDNSIARTIDVGDSSDVIVSSTSVRVILKNELSASTTYYVNIDKDAFVDQYDNTFAGIATSSTWKLTILRFRIPIVESSTTVEYIKNDNNTKLFSVNMNGKVLNDGNQTPSNRGFVINNKPNLPATEFNMNFSDAPGPYKNSTFTSTAGAFNCDTKYYFKAYATNSAGTGYGDEKEFFFACPSIVVSEPTTPPAASTGGGGGGSSSGGGGGGGASSGGGGGANNSLGNKDINSDGKVNKYDFALLMSNWGKTGSNISGDINGDSKVDKYDFALLMSSWTN